MNSSAIFFVLITPAGNLTFPNLDVLYTLLSAPKIEGIIYQNIIMILDIIGVFLNVLALAILMKGKFDAPLYFYLKLAVLASGLVNLVQIFYA